MRKENQQLCWKLLVLASKTWFEFDSRTTDPGQTFYELVQSSIGKIIGEIVNPLQSPGTSFLANSNNLLDVFIVV